MDYDRITSLLEKYWECATTVEEECELRHLFSTETLPPELRPYKAWFLTPEAETLPPLGKEFDLKVLQQIACNRRQRQRRLLYTFSALAAVVIILLVILLITFSFSILAYS